MHLTQARTPDAIDAGLLPLTRRELVAYCAWVALAVASGILLILALW